MATRLQLLSTDFDGTLFSEFADPPVPASLMTWVGARQAEGMRWVINTGRDLTSLLEAMARAGLERRPDFVVCVEREIYRHDQARYVPWGDWNERCTADHARLFRRIAPDLPRLTAWIVERFPAEIYADPWSPFCLLARSNGDADRIHEFLAEYCRSVPDLAVVRNDVYSRFSHVRYSKGTALAEIARRLGVPREGIVAAGDHFNDLPMLSLEVAGRLIAPANAVPAVKETVLTQGGRVADRPAGAGVEAVLREWFS